MNSDIRYDIFYLLEFAQYISHVKHLDMGLRITDAGKLFIEDSSNMFSEDNSIVNPHRNIYSEHYDTHYIIPIKASYYNESYIDEKEIPYLELHVVDTKNVVHICPHYNQEAISMLDDGAEPIYVDYLGSTFSKGFIPIDERYVPYLFFSDEFHNRLKESKYIIGDQIYPIDVFSEESNIYVSDHSFTSSGSSLLYRQSLVHYSGVENERRHFSRMIFQCGKCGYDKCFCPQCCSYLIKCPICGNDINITNGYFTDDEEYNFELELSLAQTFFYDPIQDEWQGLQVNPINGRLWGGLDLFYLGCAPPLWQRTFCSGRFAKWLIDNQLGPVSLIKYPVDVSECNQEELERLNAVAYGEPYISEH